MKYRKWVVCCALGVAASLSVPAPVSAQATIGTQCVASTGATCSLLRFLISADANPVAFNTFSAVLSAGSGWVFAGAPTGTFTAEDGFSFGTPFSGSSEISNGGLNLFISFLSGPVYELFPYSSGYIEVGVAGVGDAAFEYGYDDPDQVTSNGGGTIVGPPPTPDPTVVPEPMTMLLVGSGLAGIAGARRRRRAQ